MRALNRTIQSKPVYNSSMNQLHLTRLLAGEEILFGPSRTASTSNLAVTSEDDPERATRTSFRTVCVTNQRVIIESGDAAITYPNGDVSAVTIQRKSDKKTHSSWFNILQVKTKWGNTINLGIPGLMMEKEILLAETFPQASISESKGLSGWLDRLVGG